MNKAKERRNQPYVDWSSFMLIHSVQPIKEVHGHNLVKGYSILYGHNLVKGRNGSNYSFGSTYTGSEVHSYEPQAILIEILTTK